MPDTPLPPVITLTQRLSQPTVGTSASLTLLLTAEDRTRSRHRFETTDQHWVYLHLPRGTVLQEGDLLQSDDANQPVVVRVIAKPEPVLTVTAPSELALIQAAYHLGNRHVPLEIHATYLRLSPDPVLRELLERRGLQVVEELQPFHPESGAYASHSH